MKRGKVNAQKLKSGGNLCMVQMVNTGELNTNDNQESEHKAHLK